MHGLRCMWFFVACFDIDLHDEHISEVSNTTQLLQTSYTGIICNPFSPLTTGISATDLTYTEFTGKNVLTEGLQHAVQ